MNAELKAKLKELASRTVSSDNDDFNAYDYFGGNYDDAYSGGCRDGEILLAQEILEADLTSRIKDLPVFGRIEDLAPTPVATSMAPVQDETYWMRRCAHAEARLAALETFIAQMADK